ncbi:Golgi-associated kinase 1A-like [Heterodontus francisci]|uniref:Golgi-associated kinase 1A-like n=1 Tax=Heterodontus francisci TaxID=7792 RepID=UPI00355C26BD
MRLNKKKVLLCASLLGSVSLLLCMMQTLDGNSTAMGSRTHIQEAEQPYTREKGVKGRDVHHSVLQQQSKYKWKKFFVPESVQIMESNLNRKAYKARPVRKPKSKDIMKWLGEDNEIVGAPRDNMDKVTAQKSARKNNVASPIKQEVRKRKEIKKLPITSLECSQFGRFHSMDFLGGLASNKPITWFSQRDKQLVKFLSGGSVQKIDHLTRGKQVIRVILNINTSLPLEGSRDHCRAGVCGVVKGTSDLWEVAAFHLDRILGLDVSQPVVARQLQSRLLPYRYTDGFAKPVVWWNPQTSLRQGANQYLDSYFFHVAQFPSVFRQCGEKQDEVCVRDNSPQLEKLKLLDYFFQDVAIILTSFDRNRDRRTVTFNDLDWLPPNTLKTIASQCLPEMLLRSLYEDQEYWQSKGLSSLLKLVEKVSKRAQALLKYIQEGQPKRKRALV